MKNKTYDVAIIGGGVGGLFAAYRLRQLNKYLSIIILDKGNKLEERFCPASQGRPCTHCKVCAITSGIAGSGAFSDAKFNLGTAYGGTLGEELGDNTAMDYIGQVDDILKSFSEDYPDIYRSSESLKQTCKEHNLRLLDMDVRHLGTDRNIVTMQNLINDLLKTVDISPYTECNNIYKLNTRHKKNDDFFLVCKTGNMSYQFNARSVIVATGRGGADFVKHLCNNFKVETESNQVDIGVRVEMKDTVWQEFSSKIYEPKILYTTDTFKDQCRMFCFNQGGIVSAENNNGIITANGHSFADKDKKTDNCNFAILSSIRFTEPFDKPTEYAENVSSMANMIGKGNVIVQRFGDLVRGRRTNEERLASSTVKPTLNATPGDLSLVLPHRIITNIIETIRALDKVAPGTAGNDTLLYGCESKYYSLKPKHNEDFEITKDVYLIGDGSGITRGLSQSAAMGLYVADKLIQKKFGNGRGR